MALVLNLAINREHALGMLDHPQVEQFMRIFFQERTATLKRIKKIHLTYWRRFYADGCAWDSRRDVVEHSQAEEIQEVRESATGAEVVTKGAGPFRSRYHLKYTERTWLICDVDTEVGAEWRSLKDLTCRDSSMADQAPLVGDEGERGNSEEAIDREKRQLVEQFMGEHFRQRTESWTNEAKIYGQKLEAFYSLECDWRRWVASPRASEAERVESIVIISEGAQVITRGFYRHRNRYCLRSTGDGLSIEGVDNECPICAEEGKNVSCFWCGGTIWEHIKRSSR